MSVCVCVCVRACAACISCYKTQIEKEVTLLGVAAPSSPTHQHACQVINRDDA